MRRPLSPKTKKAREYSSRTQLRTASLRPCSCRPTRPAQNITLRSKDAHSHRHRSARCVVTPAHSVVCRPSVYSHSRIPAITGKAGSLTMQPPPTLHMGLHLTREPARAPLRKHQSGLSSMPFSPRQLYRMHPFLRRYASCFFISSSQLLVFEAAII